MKTKMIMLPSAGGSRTRPNVSTMPTSKDAMNAPRTEPMPPITVTTSDRMRIGSPIPT